MIEIMLCFVWNVEKREVVLCRQRKNRSTNDIHKISFFPFLSGSIQQTKNKEIFVFSFFIFFPLYITCISFYILCVFMCENVFLLLSRFRQFSLIIFGEKTKILVNHTQPGKKEIWLSLTLFFLTSFFSGK